MMDEQRTQESALIAEVVRRLEAIVESSLALVAQVTEMDNRLTRRLDELNAKLVALAADAGPRLERLEEKVDKLEEFAADAGPRLERIETHLKLNKPLPRQDTTRAEPSRHHRRKPAKRT